MNINFTIENESNGSLAFLDVKISRLNSNNTSSYHKPIKIIECIKTCINKQIATL